mgnify:CR=1 FL=1
MKYCQGPNCHTYHTQDRLRGPKGAKYYQTRRRSEFYYLGHSACSMQCERDWFNKFGEQAINHFGRIHEPIKLTADNAWYKDNDYDWQSSTHSNWRFVNKLTNEVRPITQQQYEDERFTLNTR